MRKLARWFGLLLMLGGVGVGFVALNYYSGWVDLPFEPTASWGEPLVVRERAKTVVREIDRRLRTTSVRRERVEAEDRPEPSPPSEKGDPSGAVPPTAEARAALDDAARPPWGLQHPRSMRLGDQEEVRFAIDARPDANLADALAAEGREIKEGQAQPAAVYAAQALGGLCFKVEPSERVRVAWSTTVPMVWTWTLTAKDAGQGCALDVYIGAVEDDRFTPLHLEQVKLPVERTLLRDLLGMAGPIDDVLSLLAVASTLFGAAVTWFGIRRRRP